MNAYGCIICAHPPTVEASFSTSAPSHDIHPLPPLPPLPPTRPSPRPRPRPRPHPHSLPANQIPLERGWKVLELMEHSVHRTLRDFGDIWPSRRRPANPASGGGLLHANNQTARPRLPEIMNITMPFYMQRALDVTHGLPPSRWCIIHASPSCRLQGFAGLIRAVQDQIISGGRVVVEWLVVE